MLGKIWRQIRQWIQQWFGKRQPPTPPEPEPLPLSDTGYERLLFQLLDGAADGWQPQQIAAHLGGREADRFFRSWLHRFGRQLLESPQPNRELAQRMVQLAEVLAIGNRSYRDEIRLRGLNEPAQAGLDSVAANSIRRGVSLTHQIHEIGRQLLARELPPLPEAEYEPMFQRLLAEAARGEAAVLAFLTDLSPRVTVAQWEAWLQGYGERLLAEAEPNQQIARSMIRLGELLADSPSISHFPLSTFHFQLLGFGREMRAREVVWEIWEYEERVAEAGDAEVELGEDLSPTSVESASDSVVLGGNSLLQTNNLTGNNQSSGLFNLGETEERNLVFNLPLVTQPIHETYLSQGNALVNLGRYEEAIASYDKAVEFKPDDHQAWNNRGFAVGNLTHPIQMPSLLILQNPQLNQPGYLGKIATYTEGLKHCPADTHPEGWGVLQHAMGQAHYFRGKQPNERNPRQYFIQARDCYAAALQTLTEEQFKELHLKVVRDAVKVLLSLGEREAAEEWRFHGLRVLLDLINQTPSPIVQNRLEDKFVSFRQWQVDRLVRENQFQLALETAERDKNRRLNWMLKPRRLAPRRLEIAATESKSACADLGNWQSAQADFGPVDVVSTARRLFSANTAAILYWHKSFDKLTTFILEPGAVSPRAVVADAEVLDEWIGEWDRLYRDYGTKGKSSDGGKEEHPWRREMPQRLEELGRILGVAEILEDGEWNSRIGDGEWNSRIEDGEWNSRLQGQNPPARIGESETRERRHLILIPHRELHRLPLHVLFPDYCCTYLPSLQMGLDLSQSVSDSPSSGFLSIEHPYHKGLSGLLAAEMESHLLRQMFARQIDADGENSWIEDGEWNSRLQGQNPPARIEDNDDTLHPQHLNSPRELNQPAQAGFDSVAANSIRRGISSPRIPFAEKFRRREFQSPGDFILYNKERFPHADEISPMYSSKEITLKAFLTALRQHRSPVLPEIQTQLNEIAEQLKTSTSLSVELESIAKLDETLNTNYQKARAILQTSSNKDEIGKTDPMLPIPEESGTELINLSIAVFSFPNSVESAKSLPKKGLLQRLFSLFKKPESGN